jgi:murein DD-endopeptidase MepM/ murein hydrolase activator NlpD
VEPFLSNIDSFRLSWPIASSKKILRSFGLPESDSSCKFHTGTDIAGAVGDSIAAIGKGKVVHVGPLWLTGKGYGRGEQAIVIQHAVNFYSVYSHNEKALTAVGVCVEAGEMIGQVGEEGYTDGKGPHLHLEVLFDASEKSEDLFFSKLWAVPFFNPCRFYQDFQKLFYYKSAEAERITVV